MASTPDVVGVAGFAQATVFCTRAAAAPAGDAAAKADESRDRAQIQPGRARFNRLGVGPARRRCGPSHPEPQLARERRRSPTCAAGRRRALNAAAQRRPDANANSICWTDLLPGTGLQAVAGKTSIQLLYIDMCIYSNRALATGLQKTKTPRPNVAKMRAEFWRSDRGTWKCWGEPGRAARHRFIRVRHVCYSLRTSQPYARFRQRPLMRATSQCLVYTIGSLEGVQHRAEARAGRDASRQASCARLTTHGEVSGSIPVL